MELVHLQRENRAMANDRFNAFHHVACIAPLKNDLKPVFHYVHSTGKELYGTDSKSLHISNIEEKVGYYKVIFCKSNEVVLHYEGDVVFNIPFPNCKALIDPLIKRSKKITALSVPINTGLASTLYKIARYLDEKNGLDFDRLKYLRRGWYNIYNMGENQPIYFESKEKTHSALIMPIQMKKG